MVSAWFMDSSDEDQRLEHHMSPPKFVDLEELRKLTGVLYWKVNLVNSHAVAFFMKDFSDAD